MNEEVKTKLVNLRAEWAKAPFMTKQMAGAYMGPMLDLLDAMHARNEALGKTVLDLVEERAKHRANLDEIIAKVEELGVLPQWIITW